jgi:uncharacterized protein (TIGR00255 family)
MTGMGKATRRGRGISVEVEIRSVNNRYLIIKNHFPDTLLSFEPQLHEVIRNGVVRGTVDLYIKLRMDTTTTSCTINKGILAGYIDAVKRMGKQERLDGRFTPELLLGLPGVVELKNDLALTREDLAVIKDTIRMALERLIKMRVSEGKRLTRDVLKRCRHVERILRTVGKKITQGVRERQDRLKHRLEEILKDDKRITPEDPTLQREIAVLADRSDITEEMERLKSHLAQFDKIMRTEGEMGRQLDFLLQEMGREVNTMGSKACNSDVSHDVVRMKAELEKIREQVQNIE